MFVKVIYKLDEHKINVSLCTFVAKRWFFKQQISQ
jgi:hypothetical protein